MKRLFYFSLLLSSVSFADTMDVSALKALLTQKKAVLEKINVGMSKTNVTKAKFKVNAGFCEYTLTAVQTIMRVDGAKMIVHSKENFTPVPSDACTTAKAESYDQGILFYQPVPTLTQDLADLDAASVNSLSRDADLITMEVTAKTPQADGTTVSELVTLKYDLSKPSFKNLISTVGTAFSMVTTDTADIDVNTINLKNVLFCDNNDGNTNDCAQGDYSDILF